MNALRRLTRKLRLKRGTVIRRGRFAQRRHVGTLSITITPPSPEIAERFRAALEEAIIRGDHLTTVRDEIERIGRAVAPIHPLINAAAQAARDFERHEISDQHAAALCGMTVEEYRTRQEQDYLMARFGFFQGFAQGGYVNSAPSLIEPDNDNV